jgi:hypothetical protein
MPDPNQNHPNVTTATRTAENVISPTTPKTQRHLRLTVGGLRFRIAPT